MINTALLGRVALRRAIAGQTATNRLALAPILRGETGAPALPPSHRG